MITLGLVGGVASGKSAAARFLAQHVPGTVHIDADRIGHETLEIPSVKAALVAHWGDKILNDAGQINRSAVAKIVFAPGNDAELQFLESKSHPHIRKAIRDRIKDAEAAGAPLVIVDAALLLETGWGELCDVVAFVDTPAELRQQRAHEHRRWNAAEFARREAAQWSVDQKRAAAKEAIPNAGSEAELAKEVAHLWERIKE
jgi:dephospho-CoA kinase